MTNLFVPPGKRLALDLQKAAQAANLVFPLKRPHLLELPCAVKDLSRLLTSERDQKRAYWSSPRLLGAYLRYFLPWNLLRLAWLLPSLPLDLPPGGKILDLGSGPLTLPVGLWVSRPELRGRELTLFCSDTAPRPLELGRDLLRRLAEPEAPGPPEAGPRAALPWRLNLLRAPLETALRKIGSRVNLITAANVLNELPTPRQESLEERLGGLFVSMNRALEPGGQLLLIEPGTRLGGKLMEIMRGKALEHGFSALAPCTHDRDCPFLEAKGGQEEEDYPGQEAFNALRGGRGRPQAQSGRPDRKSAWQPRPSGWCHFSHGVQGATPELLRLSSAAELQKDRLHLSFVLLRKPGSGPAVESPASGSDRTETAARGKLAARVVSDPIRLPGEGADARYVCTEAGLGLLRRAAALPSGAQVRAVRDQNAARDAKTGAIPLLPDDGR